MNMFKKNGGFTLVELIVVIAILAILAGVAIPAYSGYINKANETADTALIESLETGLNAAFAFKGIAGDARQVTVSAVTKEDNKNTYQVSFTFSTELSEVASAFADFVGKTATDRVVTITGLKNNGAITYNPSTGALTQAK